MAIAINDIDTLKKIAYQFSNNDCAEFTDCIFVFYFFPLSEDTSELLGRVSPDIRDVLNCIFWWFSLNYCTN